MVSFGERLREERERLSLTQAQFGQLAQVTKKTQMLYESGERSPKADYMTAIASSGVDVQYLLTGERTVRLSESANGDLPGCSVEPFEVPMMGENLAAVPMYDIEAAAGDGRSLEAEEVETTIYFPGEQLAAQGLDPAHVVGVKVRGDSMDGTLADGDWVLVDRSQREPKPEGVFLLLVHGERRIKRVQRVAGGAWLLISDNDHYQPELIKPEDMKDVAILGRCEIRIGRIV